MQRRLSGFARRPDLGRAFAAVSLFLCMCSCGGGDPDLQAAPAPTNDQRRAFSRASYDLGAAVYGRLAEERGNVIYAPASTQLALSAIAAGARGETLDELSRALGTEDLEGTHRTANDALRSWARSREQRASLFAAIRIYVDESARVAPTYEPLARDRYGARVVAVDFQGGAPGVRSAIEAWAREATGVELSPPSSAITSRTRLAVASPVRFVGPWDQGFPTHATRPEHFRRADGSTVTVPTMHVEGVFGVMETDDAQAVELRYKGGRFGLVLVRPRADDAPLESIGLPTAARWAEWRRRGLDSRGGVRLALPRFAVASAPIDVAAHLSDAGVRALFDRERADLSGLAESDAGLFLDSLVQRAAIEVDEEGTRAEAVTVATGVARSAQPPTVLEIRFDRPFLFMVRDRRLDILLFIGRVEELPGA